MTLVIDPQTAEPGALANALFDLAMCVCEELGQTAAGEPCWCGLWPGSDVSWEYCGDCSGGRCGMAWVRLVGITPYEVFPSGVVDLRCAFPLAAQVELGALRCMPTPADGEIASPGDLAQVAFEQYADGLALYRAVQCCPRDPGSSQIAIAQYTPVGPAGGCVGGFWTAYIALD